MPGLEADDALGIAATSGEFSKLCPDIAGQRHAQQIPCRIYDLKKEFTQTLKLLKRSYGSNASLATATDGYKGAARCGTKTS